MASGCIMGTCPICDEFVYEDEWVLYGEEIIHESCREQAFLLSKGIRKHNLEQARKVDVIVEALKNLEAVVENCENEIKRLELMIKEVERIETEHGGSREVKSRD
jgi:hypothetical protein